MWSKLSAPRRDCVSSVIVIFEPSKSELQKPVVLRPDDVGDDSDSDRLVVEEGSLAGRMLINVVVPTSLMGDKLQGDLRRLKIR